MATMKRRVIYVDDETWEAIRSQADARGLTISEVLRLATKKPLTRPIEGPTERSATMARSHAAVMGVTAVPKPSQRPKR